MTSALRALATTGVSVREAAWLCGVSKETARKYLNGVRLRQRVRCECGQRAGHRGWCAVRYAKSPERQAMMVRLHGAR